MTVNRINSPSSQLLQQPCNITSSTQTSTVAKKKKNRTHEVVEKLGKDIKQDQTSAVNLTDKKIEKVEKVTGPTSLQAEEISDSEDQPIFNAPESVDMGSSVMLDYKNFTSEIEEKLKRLTIEDLPFNTHISVSKIDEINKKALGVIRIQDKILDEVGGFAKTMASNNTLAHKQLEKKEELKTSFKATQSLIEGYKKKIKQINEFADKYIKTLSFAIAELEQELAMLNNIDDGTRKSWNPYRINECDKNSTKQLHKCSSEFKKTISSSTIPGSTINIILEGALSDYLKSHFSSESYHAIEDNLRISLVKHLITLVGDVTTDSSRAETIYEPLESSNLAAKQAIETHKEEFNERRKVLVDNISNFTDKITTLKSKKNEIGIEENSCDESLNQRQIWVDGQDKKTSWFGL